ncbi:uncharacterized protein LOC117291264 [Asterias rubens]|uniref:uncharacterized protein LOC117291264 n=1 Tax=Asterias rubens TaxID=7604 RepID=UPI00145565D7|nr:uncharacterized protein LOC117291264 [Asterias rubens]
MALIDAKFQSWATIKENLQTVVRTSDPQDMCVTIPYGLQLYHSMHHPHVVRCLAFYHSTARDVYVTHIDTGACNEIYVWTISSLDENAVKCIKFPMKAAISRMIYIAHHRVFVGFCNDMTLRTFSDLIHNCAELTQITCLSTVLCMAYNECNDELITGGHGCLQTWKMTHIELRDPLTPGRPMECQITPNDWVRDLQIDKKHRQLVVLCDEGVCIIDYQTNKQVFFIRNWHETALTSCVFYRRLEYFITAAMDGSIKVWNAVVYSQVHEFIGHYDCVTGLVMHPTDPLLISSSKDGTIRMWRLDTFELTQRLDVGEKILGMRIANHNQLYYHTLHDVKVYNFNQFHHIFTPVQSCIHKLAKVKTKTAPTRILCAAEDGGVRLISAVSGTILTIIYPMATYQVLTDLVYDPKHDVIYTVMATGDVLVFESGTNPCTANQLWIPGLPDECVLCLALVKLDCALGKQESSSESLIFAGLNSGQIILLEAQDHFMKIPVKAHLGHVTVLETSHGLCDGENNGVGGADRLLSCGSDKNVCVWAIELSGTKNLKVNLTCMKMITSSLCPSHVSMLQNSLCMVLPNNDIHVYELLDTVEETAGEKDEKHCTTSKMLKSATMYTHLKEHNHTKMVTALCSCPSLGIFASTSSDGSVKLWDLTNTLVRELCFDPSLRSVCFANDRGDLLVGFQNHVSYISICTYLPLSYMEKVIEMDFKDEEIEEPIRFNPDLQLWFNISSLPTFPTDIILRRHMQQSMDHLQKHLQSIGPPGDRGDSEVISTLAPALDEPKAVSVPSVRQCQTKHHARFSIFKPSIIEDVVIPETPSDGAVKSQQKEEKDVSPQVKDDADDAPSATEEEALVQDGDEDESREEAELGGLLEEEKEEEEYNPWPIAPDGYIPNSVIKSIMGYHHTLEPIPESPWKPKAFEVMTKTSAESDSCDKPFTWVPSSSEEEEELDYLSYESLQDEASRTKFFQDLGMADMSDKQRRQTLAKLQLSGMGLPGKVAIPQLELLGKKGKGGKQRRKSRGINTKEAAIVRRKVKMKSSGMTMEDDSGDEEEEIFPDDGTPKLLKQIAANVWFPRGISLQVEPVVRTLLDLLDDVADLQYRHVCEALVQIYKHLGMSDLLLETVLTKCRTQLKSSKAIVRANTVKTLTSFGLDRRDVILSLLPALADCEEDVRQETVKAVDALAGIQGRSGLMGYLEKIGFLRTYHGQEEVIQELARRYTPDPTHHRPSTLHPSRIQLLARRRNNEEDVLPIEGLPCVSPVINVDNWLSQYQMELGRRPSEDLSFDDELSGTETLQPWRGKVSNMQRKYMPLPDQRVRKTCKQQQRPTGNRRASVHPAPTGRLKPIPRDQKPDEMRRNDEWLPQMPVGKEDGASSYDRSMILTHGRKTKHAQLLQAHDETIGLEKDQMVYKMQAKLHCHHEHYEKLKQLQQAERRRKSSYIPSNSRFYTYYSRQAQIHPSDSDEWETDTSQEWSNTALQRVKAVIEAFSKMPSKPLIPFWELPSESGVGGSSLLGTSMPKMDGEDKGRQGEVEGSSGFFTEVDLLGQGSMPERPMSKLTVRNLQKHDAISGKAKVVLDDSTLSTNTYTSHQIQKNWREFFSLPFVQRRKKQKGALPSHNAPASFQPIKCISSKVKVESAQGEKGQRLLDEVFVDPKRVEKRAGQGEVFCTPVPEKLTIDTKNRSSGVSQYGNLEMSWTTKSPIRDKDVNGRKVVSFTTVVPDYRDKEQRKQWLQQQMLYPSLYQMRILDEKRKRRATMVNAQQKSPHLPLLQRHSSTGLKRLQYRWSSPEPVVCSQKLNKKSSVRKPEPARIQEREETVEKESKIKKTHIYLPYLPYVGTRMPIVPHNSTISHQSSMKLPKIKPASAGSSVRYVDDLPRLQEKVEGCVTNPITIPQE